MVPPSDLASSAEQLERSGSLQQAQQLYRQALSEQPGDAVLWLRLGQVCQALSQPDEAVICYEQAARLRSDDSELLCSLGVLRMQRGELAEAVACYEQVLRLQPDSVMAHNNLGLALLNQGRVETATLCFQQALSLRPDLGAVHNNLGLALLNQGQPHQAQPCFEAALRLEPALADAHNNLGLALDAQAKPDDAIACYERAVETDPAHLGALTNLGNAFKDQGRAADAIACYRRALELRPGDAAIHSNLLLAMQYQPGADPGEILAEARRYARQHVDPQAARIDLGRAWSCAGPRLRIGYVSPDFREHPVVHFLEPLLSAHDHQQFEIFCYADVPQSDAVTGRLQGYADHWRSLVGLSDAQAAEVIHQDGIAILIDLAGHTGGNRLSAFARKPAPIQASYLGYLGTTGLDAMDYYITDDLADPTGVADAHYQEQLVRLPECGVCYWPGPAPEVRREPPGRQFAQITFGCLNTLAKVSEEVLVLWSRVLLAVPGSRLSLRTGAGRVSEERTRAVLAGQGVSPERLLLAGRAATRVDYLKLYHTVDIGLDPFPYNGVTTTCDSLWMGVPVISLAGRMNVSRQGVRFLRSVGLDGLLADTPEDYVRIATDLARDSPRLAALRSSLREQMSRSPLVSAHRLARELEAAYRAMWQKRLAVLQHPGDR
jgi:predicted O-linked N-acetylglucosamine transferase (SPINDLY family)